MAYLRRKISGPQLTDVCQHVLPEIGGELATRLLFAVALGPVYAWWLLASSVVHLTNRDTPKPAPVIGKLVMRQVQSGQTP